MRESGRGRAEGAARVGRGGAQWAKVFLLGSCRKWDPTQPSTPLLLTVAGADLAGNHSPAQNWCVHY